MSDVHTPCSFHVVTVVLFFLWAGCKGPIAHDPASNAPTTKESSAKTPSTGLHHTRTNSTNHPSPAVHDPSTVKQQGKPSSNRPHTGAEPDEPSLDESFCMIFAPGGMLFTPGSESNTANKQDETPSDRPHTDAEPDEPSLDESSCMIFTPRIEFNTANKQGKPSSNRPHVVSGSTLSETDAMAQKFGMPVDKLIRISRNLELNMEKTNETQLGESFDSTESHRLDTTEHGRAETLPWDVLGEEIQQDIEKVTQEIDSKNYDQGIIMKRSKDFVVGRRYFSMQP
jgi:hypothetical protein